MSAKKPAAAGPVVDTIDPALAEMTAGSPPVVPAPIDSLAELVERTEAAPASFTVTAPGH